jgi:hypothetical protein
MALNIINLLAQINKAGGLAQQNRYEVYIPTSRIAQASTKIFNAQANADAMDWIADFYAADVNEQGIALLAFCEKTTLPSYQFQTDTQRIYGPAYKFPHLPEFQDITMTFMCGAAMNEKYFFDAWQYLIMDPVTNDFNYLSEYAVDIDIVMYSESSDATNSSWYSDLHKDPSARFSDFISNPIQAYVTTLYDAYPVAVNAIDLGYDHDNAYASVQVTFTYKSAFPFDGKGSTSGMGLRGKREIFNQTIKPPV